MKPLARRVIVALVAAWGAGCHRSPPQVQHQPTPAVGQPDRLPEKLSIPLSQHNGYLRARTKINNQEAGLFMIDTGSSENAVLPAIADQLYLPKGAGGVADGIGGRKAFTYRNAENLSIGGLVLNGNRLAALDLHWFTSSFGGMVSGIIGFQAFGQVPLTIDYQNSLLTVHHPDHFQPPSGAKAYRLWSYRGLPMIRVVVGQKHEAWLIVDTGAETHITLPMACAVTWPDIVMVPITSPGRARGIGGSVNTAQTWLTSIHLLGLDLRRTPVSFEAQASTPQRPHSPPIGRIGNQLLRHFHLTFDPKNNRLWVRWRGGDRSPPKSP